MMLDAVFHGMGSECKPYRDSQKCSYSYCCEYHLFALLSVIVS
jgi:hypothetical protein